uniref:Vacuolar transport chaperone-like protein n=1 Tax=Podoviridae sp. ctfAL26 TaxID=2825265 RepID=A0A8S5PEM8_9CAUD|nr:MAG TPA: vacuolar transport chaperone-like protein [Podoviridae sp. ctfAL26]
MDFTDVLSALWQGNYVEYNMLKKYLGLQFAECMKNLDMNRIARWSKNGNGQDITVMFRCKGAVGEYCLTERGLISIKDI